MWLECPKVIISIVLMITGNIVSISVTVYKGGVIKCQSVFLKQMGLKQILSFVLF
jgi:hypothetical protein